MTTIGESLLGFNQEAEACEPVWALAFDTVEADELLVVGELVLLAHSGVLSVAGVEGIDFVVISVDEGQPVNAVAVTSLDCADWPHFVKVEDLVVVRCVIVRANHGRLLAVRHGALDKSKTDAALLTCGKLHALHRDIGLPVLHDFLWRPGKVDLILVNLLSPDSVGAVVEGEL